MAGRRQSEHHLKQDSDGELDVYSWNSIKLRDPTIFKPEPQQLNSGSSIVP